MNKAIQGIWLSFFRIWLYAPLALLLYADYSTLPVWQTSKVGFAIGIVASLGIFYMVLLSKDFREFWKVTPLRILQFFALIFGVTLALILIWVWFARTFQWTTYLLTTPGWAALLLTPAMVVRADFFSSKLNPNPSSLGSEKSEP